MRNAFFTTLRVHTHAFEIVRRCARQQPQIPAAQHFELFQRLANARVGVPESLGPQVLIVAGQRRAILREHHSQPPAPYEFRVCEVLQHVAH